MKGVLHRIMEMLAPLVPAGIKEGIRSHVSIRQYDAARQRRSNPFLGMNAGNYRESRYRFAILEDLFQDHQYFVAACREMQISYKLIDLFANDWLEQLRGGHFDAVLAWPHPLSSRMKEVIDYRLWIIERVLGVPMYPTWAECFLTEHKPRLRDWLEAKGIPHPETWVFHDRETALDFAARAQLPIVLKTATGAGATGVFRIHSRRGLVRMIAKAFGRGIRGRRSEARDRQRDYVYLQEFFPDVHEWRMVRIGDSFFGYRKEKGDDGLHSASHKWSWLDPGERLLNLLKRVTDAGGFTSMDVDVFETPDGRLLVNEMQAVFGCTTPVVQMKVDGVEGRYLWSEAGWTFQAGEFCRNHMCNSSF